LEEWIICCIFAEKSFLSVLLSLRHAVMWSKPWTLKAGFLIGGGLIVAGLLLELSVGGVVWSAYAWPVNVCVLVGFLVFIAAVFLLRRRVYAFQFLGTSRAAIPAMVYAVVLTVVMGLTRQQADGTWLNSMLTFWPFVLTWVYVAVILGVGDGVASLSGAAVALPGAPVGAYMKSLSPSIWKEGTGRAVVSGSRRIFWDVLTRSCAFSA
jgi:hypothetical protein